MPPKKSYDIGIATPRPRLPEYGFNVWMRARLNEIEECLSAINLLHHTRQHSSSIDLPFSAVGTRNVGVDDHLIPHAL
jgi:hypothetical protein